MIINKVAITVPKSEMAISQFVEAGIMTAEQYGRIAESHGETVRYDPSKSGIDLILASMDNLMEDSTVDRARITYVVICYGDMLVPHTYTLNRLMTNRYQLDHTQVFAVRDLYCSTSIMGLKICRDLLAAGGDGDQAVLIVAERSHTLQQRFDDYFVTGDSAIAVLLSKAGEGDTIAAVLHETTMNIDTPYGDYFTPINLTKLLHQTTKAAGVPVSALKKIVTSNVNSGVWSAVAKTAKLPRELFFKEKTGCYGPLEMTDGFINYAAFIREERVAEGEYFALLTLGLYGGIGCAVCRRS